MKEKYDFSKGKRGAELPSSGKRRADFLVLTSRRLGF